MNKVVSCKKSKKGNLYLSCKSKTNELLLVNLIKDDKRYNPSLKENTDYEVSFASFKLDADKKVIALFDVTDIVEQSVKVEESAF